MLLFGGSYGLEERGQIAFLSISNIMICVSCVLVPDKNVKKFPNLAIIKGYYWFYI